MKKFLMVSALAGLFAAGSAVAGNYDRVNISWHDVENYKDINPAEETVARFNKRMFSSFERQFVQLAKKLPEGYTMKVVVTDVDLAGRVLPTNKGSLRLTRVIEHNFKPSISLSFAVFNAEGKQVLSSQDVNLDSKVTHRAPRRQHMHREFSYDNYFVKKWFNDSVLPQVVAKS